MKFTKKEKNLLAEIFAYLDPKVWARNDTATVHMFGGHYYIKKVENGYKFKWVDTVTGWVDNSPLNFIDDLAKING